MGSTSSLGRVRSASVFLPLAAFAAALIGLSAPAMAESGIAIGQAPPSFVESVRHPEDLDRLTGTRWVIVSDFQPRDGALFAVDSDSPERAVVVPWAPGAASGRISATEFSPHGIAAKRRSDGRYELLVVDHGGGKEAIDWLVLDASGQVPTVVEGKRIAAPQGTSGNAVAFVPGGGFVMTSMFDPDDRTTVDKVSAGKPTGGVWRWTSAQGWKAFGPRLPGANGIAVTPDGAHLFVNAWSSRTILKLAMDGKEEARASVDFLPDNLRWNGDDHLLIGGQAATAHEIFTSGQPGARFPKAYVVAELDTHTMTVRELVRKNDDDAVREGFGAATGALVVGRSVWVGSFMGDVLARFAIQTDPAKKKVEGDGVKAVRAQSP
ncbi:hypothetical protein [Luteibacter sp. 3190]|uniref:SMP-30/gluconolactonase/LRE family protein n=1 Tax=Luteibacter sp. 3190 TaxID=2817736 RepID=UPI00285F52E5|nr:hypothetical protein [Luteibacter sp. 3190]MDR6938215.1 sugar lactone lactonase YvrE [Luteibacter sp. 3190]